MQNKQTVEDFLTQSYKMGGDYEKLQQLMGYIYSRMQQKQELDSKELLLQLTEISRSMLNTQRDFVEVYADDSIKAQMYYKIDAKEQVLSLSESELREKSYK